MRLRSPSNSRKCQFQHHYPRSSIHRKYRTISLELFQFLRIINSEKTQWMFRKSECSYFVPDLPTAPFQFLFHCKLFFVSFINKTSVRVLNRQPRRVCPQPLFFNMARMFCPAEEKDIPVYQLITSTVTARLSSGTIDTE